MIPTRLKINSHELLDWLFGEPSNNTRKRIFISFAIEDSLYRDFLKGHAKNKCSPFDFIDMSVKTPWNNKEWQMRCRTKIRRCHGLIVLLSPKIYHSSGARWEIKCAKEERVPIVGMHISKNERGSIPPELKGRKVFTWSWNNSENFIKSI